MNERRNGEMPVTIIDNNEVEVVKRHLWDHTRTRYLLGPFDEELRSAQTMEDVVGVIQNLKGEDLEDMAKILTGWSNKPNRKGYESSLASDSLRAELREADLLRT